MEWFSESLVLEDFSAPLCAVDVQDMYRARGTSSDCEQCRRAMSSVMDANLLLFKTVIAGDSWGEIAVPVIQEHPETAVIFVGSSLPKFRMMGDESVNGDG